MMGKCDVPEDVIIDILLRLPVKSLLRFKCVSGSWCALIKSPRFITDHLANYKNNNGRLLVHNYDPATDKYVFALYPDETLALPVPVFQYLDGMSMDVAARVLGPCNGIFCLFNHVDRAALWNPATREFRVLPTLPSPNLPPELEMMENALFAANTLGFGLDPLTNDYKVVWIRTYGDDIHTLGHELVRHKHAAVYALSSDSWTDFKGVLPAKDVFCGCSMVYTYMNGAFYWVASGKNNNMVLSFDFGDEVFQWVPEPERPDQDSGCSYFVLYNDSIARILTEPNETQTETSFHIWVMKEDHWTKEATIGPLPKAEIPLGFWKNGELLVAASSTGQLHLSDSTTLQLKDLGTKAVQVFVYSESLVSIKGGNYDFLSAMSIFRFQWNHLTDSDSCSDHTIDSTE